MSVTNGQRANATNFNAAFVSRSATQSVAGGKQFTNYVSLTESAVASAATITSLSSSTSKVRLTGTTATALQGVSAGVSGQVLFIYNATNQTITVKHQNVGASAAARIITYSAGDLLVLAGDTLLLTYDGTQSRWVQSCVVQNEASDITALTGDVTASGSGSVAATLATVNSNVGSFGTATQVSTVTVNAKGLVTAASNTSIQIAESQVTNLVSDLAGKQATGNYITALTGDVTASGPGSSAATIANDAVSNAKAANMATQTIKGRTTAGTGDPEDLTATQATAILNNMVGDSGSGGTKGLVPAPAAGDTAGGKFLKADGTWAAPAGSSSTAPTAQVFTSGSGTYTRPTSPTPLYLKVKMCGGGGGGSTSAGGYPGSGGGAGSYQEVFISSPSSTYSYGVGAGGSAGNNGGNTTFASNTAGGGTAGGGSGANGGAGGTNTIGTGTSLVNIAGGGGEGPSGSLTSGGQCGGQGGTNIFGGQGISGIGTNAAGGNAATNSGAGGTGGSSSSGTGGNGGSGLIIVEEYYQ